MALGRTNINLPEIPLKPKAVYLYKEGDEYDEVAGGWNSVVQTSTNYTSTGLTVNRNSDNLEVSISTTSSNSKNRCGTWYAKNKIDFSKYNKLCALIKGTGTDSNGRPGFGATESINSDGSVGTVLSNVITMVGDYTLFEVDLSSVNGEGYVYGSTWAKPGYSSSIFIKEVWLEP